MIECLGFAWQLSDALLEAGKEGPVYTLENSLPWEVNDVGVRLPPSDLDQWGNLAQLVFWILKEEKFKVVGSMPMGLPPTLWSAERNGGGASVPTPPEVNEAVGMWLPQDRRRYFGWM